jgi:hypothetical protein
MNKFFEVM